MGFLLEDDPSCMVLTHVLYKVALAFAVLRWLLSCALRLRECLFANPSPVSSLPSSVSPWQISQNLALTTYGDVKDRQGGREGVPDACAVCLGLLSKDDEVRELRNCCHVFHRDCIDRWVDHDDHHDGDHHDGDHHDDDHGNHKSCPLCRAPLLTVSQVVAHDLRSDDPSWTVERLLYLFGDDLLA